MNLLLSRTFFWSLKRTLKISFCLQNHLPGTATLIASRARNDIYTTADSRSCQQIFSFSFQLFFFAGFNSTHRLIFLQAAQTAKRGCAQQFGFVLQSLSAFLIWDSRSLPVVSGCLLFSCCILFVQSEDKFYSTSCRAAKSSSPVLTFTTCRTSYTKIFPSPICPV